MIASHTLFLAAALAANATVPNPLVDPGFETEGAAGALSSWIDCGPTPARLQTTTVHGGRYAVTLAPGAAICQRIVLPMARSIVLDFWEKPTVPSGEAATREVSFYDKRPDGTMDMIQPIMSDPVASAPFTHYTFDVTALMGQTLYVFIGLHDGTPGAGASLVIDDVTLQASDPMKNRS